MADLSERRKYKRWYTPLCKAFISDNAKTWEPCEICDLSAGGLKFEGAKVYPIGQNIYLKITVFSSCSEFTMSLKAQIAHGESKSYGVKFTDISKSQQIQLDEIITSAIEKNHDGQSHHHKFDEGIYAFCFNPLKRKYLTTRK